MDIGLFECRDKMGKVGFSGSDRVLSALDIHVVIKVNDMVVEEGMENKYRLYMWVTKWQPRQPRRHQKTFTNKS